MRRGDRLYMNDGIYGSFDEQRFAGFDENYPPSGIALDAKGKAKLLSGEKRPFRAYGPTCDSADVLPRPVFVQPEPVYVQPRPLYEAPPEVGYEGPWRSSYRYEAERDGLYARMQSLKHDSPALVACLDGVVDEFVAAGLPIVRVLPTTIAGPGDWKPTPNGRRSCMCKAF